MGAIIVFLLYCSLLASVPIALLFPGILAGGIVSIALALALIVTATTSLCWEQHRLPRLVSPVLLVGLAGTYLVLLLQIVPMPSGPLTNPIWNSAAAAFGEKTTGSITIDTGVTLLAICHLNSMVAVALLAAMFGQLRRRAEWLLAALAAIATLVSFERILGTFWIPETFRFLPATAYSAAETISMFGVVLAVAMIIRSYERSRQQQSNIRIRRPAFTAEIAAAFVACLINLGAVASSDDPTSLFAALLGASLLIAILIIRKGRLGQWGQAGTAAVLTLSLVTFIALMPGRVENEAITRMTDDARLLGIGAGALPALAPIYGEASAVAVPNIPVVATVAVEMGRPFLWLIAILAVAWGALLLHAALKRGRDYVYPAAGAGCIAVLLISGLSNGGGLALAPSIVLSAVIGLAIAQSKGETAITDGSAIPGMPPATTINPLSFRWYLYSALTMFGLILTAQGAWIVLPEALRPGPISFPSDQIHAMVARQDQERANRSAAIAGVRGDLWAESAFTEAALVWTDPAFKTDISGARKAMTSMSLLKTLHYAPHRSDAWLMLASTCERLKLSTCNIGAFLKMSYYTAPDEPRLLLLRLAQALRIKDISGDDELVDMIRRDIRFVLTRSANLRPALISAYRTASPAGRLLVEQTVTPVDPGYMTMLRTT
ncbi:MAG: hypothetical protein CFE29_05070 [Bradyrhizobiaceae bacterium PARB1]|jgi:hypothetical protein|nr:MAG: hypothetical protein CFE29_05070 [Bradyrhizobiaceae bacterium PARB1]